jgi:hypothetical protein
MAFCLQFAVCAVVKDFRAVPKDTMRGISQSTMVKGLLGLRHDTVTSRF